MHLLATGRYLTMLGGLVLQHNAARWSLKRLPIDLRALRSAIAIFILKHRTISPVARAFIEQVKANAQSSDALSN
jgi:DNA-binding transcriptional LysR family regulator